MPSRISRSLIRVFAALVVVLAAAGSARAQNVVLNPGFETGNLNNWTVDGTNNPPIVNNANPHTGTFSALLGDLDPAPEPFGDSSFYQTIVVPPAASVPHLTFWRQLDTLDSITFDWQDVYVTNTSGTILATVQHLCETSPYTMVDFNMTPFAGQTVRIKFLVHQDGFGDDTSMWLDDVSVAPTVPVALMGVTVE